MAGQPDTVTIEGQRSVQLDIQVRCPSPSARVNILVQLTSYFFPQPDSVHTVQDALAHIFRPRFTQVGASGPSTGEASRQVTVLMEALPSVLVLHLKRFSYDAATGGVVKNSKPVQFSSELEIPPGTFCYFPPSSAAVRC
jgi:hypothetical protein